jgi:hypothetical protein
MARVRELPTAGRRRRRIEKAGSGRSLRAFAPGVGFENRSLLPPRIATTHDKRSAPQVSFCIPTYNRCRYLASLLESLVVQLADFPFSFES